MISQNSVLSELSLQRVEMRVDRRVDMRQIRQISQKTGELWSPEFTQHAGN